RGQHLVAWVHNNPRAKDQVWSVMEAARRMGGQITEAEAEAVIEDASVIDKPKSADEVARFLRVTYAERQTLHLTAIGSIDVSRRGRKLLRKRRGKGAKGRRRRAIGKRPPTGTRTATPPWRTNGMSRTRGYRRNKSPTGTN